MKTTWNVIKSKAYRLKGHSNYEHSPDTFNDHFLSIAEKMVQIIRHSDTEDTSDNKNPMYYVFKIFHNPFPNIKFNNKRLIHKVSFPGAVYRNKTQLHGNMYCNRYSKCSAFFQHIRHRN
jgi:hypothetical protein